MMAVPSAVLAEGSVLITSVTLQGDANGTGCAIWLEPAQPIRFGVLKPPARAEDQLVSQQFSLRIVNGRDVSTSSCVVTAGGASFRWNDAEVLPIHTAKLSQAAGSSSSTLLVPQVNVMAEDEPQSILVKSPRASGCAIVIATIDLSSLAVLPTDAIVLGTLTLTMSNTAP